jgi:asparagine synthase (glutamine-hydrolysing)
MLFGCAAIRATTAQTTIQAPHQAIAEGLRVALQGGPVLVDGTESADPAAAVLGLYRAHDTGFPAHLAGRFSVVVQDHERDRVVLALDRMGIERLAWATDGNSVAFGCSAREVAGALGATPRLRSQSLFDYLLLHMIPAPGTAWEGVSKLQAGSTVVVGAQSAPETRRYWRPHFGGEGEASFDHLRGGLHTALETAVARCRPDARTGAFLSGGLDSSSVAGILGRVSGDAPRTFSIGFGVESFNELAYARLAARHFGAASHEYEVTADDVADAFLRIAAACDEPFGNSSVIPTHCCAVLAARNGIDHLLAGDGGDELFGGNERYARQRVFEAYGRIPGLLRHGLVEPLARAIDPDSRITPLRKLRSYVDQACIPMPERLESWNYMYREDLGAMLAPEFRAAVDPRAPLERMAALYAEAPSDELLHRMLFFDWHYTLADNDLRKVGMMCELAGVRVSYPMLDPGVIDLSLRVPASMMMDGPELRTFYRRAMRGFLPAGILAKRKHGFGLPFGIWLKDHARLRELIFGLLSAFKARRIVRPEFIDRLIAGQRDGDAGYFGYAIWDLAMLEAWLASH